MFGEYNPFFKYFMFTISEGEKQRMRESYGITNKNGLDGVEKLNIPHQYLAIEVKDGYYYCHDGKQKITIYNSKGENLFKSRDLKYVKQGAFLVSDEKENKKYKRYGYALWVNGEFVTDFLYRTSGLGEEFNKQGFITVNCMDYSDKAIINLKGEEIYRDNHAFDYISLYGVVAKVKKGYLNLLTNEYICAGVSYRNTIDIEDYLFVKTESSCVYQVDKHTGHIIIIGEEKEKKKKILTEKQEKEREAEREAKRKIDDAANEESEKWQKLNRNDKCLCGSGKKFKACCINNWKGDLRKKYYG